jgi:hypothetical protein
MSEKDNQTIKEAVDPLKSPSSGTGLIAGNSVQIATQMKNLINPIPAESQETVHGEAKSQTPANINGNLEPFNNVTVPLEKQYKIMTEKTQFYQQQGVSVSEGPTADVQRGHQENTQNKDIEMEIDVKIDNFDTAEMDEEPEEMGPEEGDKDSVFSPSEATDGQSEDLTESDDSEEARRPGVQSSRGTKFGDSIYQDPDLYGLRRSGRSRASNSKYIIDVSFRIVPSSILGL